MGGASPWERLPLPGNGEEMEDSGTVHGRGWFLTAFGPSLPGCPVPSALCPQGEGRSASHRLLAPLGPARSPPARPRPVLTSAPNPGCQHPWHQPLASPHPPGTPQLQASRAPAWDVRRPWGAGAGASLAAAALGRLRPAFGSWVPAAPWVRACSVPGPQTPWSSLRAHPGSCSGARGLAPPTPGSRSLGPSSPRSRVLGPLLQTPRAPGF